MTECVSEGEALNLLAAMGRGECANCPSGGDQLEAALVFASQRHWWSAARGIVDVLRRSNFQVSSEVRRALTDLRDESGAVLALMRQTAMDEALIHCATMWAQGDLSVHLNVKFALRLDAPVTVLNVDHEQVTINSTHVTFSGIGRQKPKRYVVEIELHGLIDPNASSWSFGSVGTVRFVLKKASEGAWPSLYKNPETAKSKHRTWWEHEEKVVAADKATKAKAKAAEVEAQRLERERQQAEKREIEEEEKRVAAAAAEARRQTQLPLLEQALTALDAFVEASGQGSDVAGAAYDGCSVATTALLEAVGQHTNESAAEHAMSLVNTVRTLGSLGNRELTQDAQDSAVAQYKSFCESLVEPAAAEPPDPQPAASSSKRKLKKKRKKTKAKSSDAEA